MVDNRCSTELPRIPYPPGKTVDLISRIMAFSSVSTFVLAVSNVLIIILQMSVTVYWMEMMYGIENTSPKTYAWELVIRMFGSWYNDCVDWHGTTPIRLTAPEFCPYNYNRPPILSSFVCLMSSSIACVLFYWMEIWYFNKVKLAPKLMYILFTLAILTYMLSISIIGVVTTNAKKNLSKRMREEISLVNNTPTHISPRWELTHRTHKCCGIYNFTDWNFEVFKHGHGNLKFPRSCCNSDSFRCRKYPNRAEVWSAGCLDPELHKVQFYAKKASYLMSVGVVCLGILTLQVYLTHTVCYGWGSGSSSQKSYIRNVSRSRNISVNVFNGFSRRENGSNHEVVNSSMRILNSKLQNKRSVGANGGSGDHRHVLGKVSITDSRSGQMNQHVAVDAEPNNFQSYFNKRLEVERHSKINIKFGITKVECKINSQTTSKINVPRKESLV